MNRNHPRETWNVKSIGPNQQSDINHHQWEIATILLNLCTPDGKRLATTTAWPHFLIREWPKHRAIVAKKFPGHVWR